MRKNHVSRKEKLLRHIEEEIFEVLFDLQNQRESDERIKMGEILYYFQTEESEITEDLSDKTEKSLISKSQLTNIIQRKFQKNNYVDYQTYEGLFLTKKGYVMAKRAARNHRISEALLGILGVDWSLIHIESCEIEHGITPIIADAILSKLPDPPITPFGTPIPNETDEREECLICKDLKLTEVSDGTSLILKKIIRPQTQKLMTKLNYIGIKTINTNFKKVEEKESNIIIQKDGKIEKLTLKEAQRIAVELIVE